MAINLLGSTNSFVSYGDITAISGLSAISVAINLKPTSSTASEPLLGQWDNLSENKAFLVSNGGSRRVKFTVTDGTLTFSKETTATERLSTGSLHRVVATWIAGTPGTMHIVVDGVDEALTAVTSNDPLTLQNASQSVKIARDGTNIDGPDGDYSDAAIWTRELPLEAAKAISNGVSPLFYGKDLLLYDRLQDTNSARDIIGGIIPSIAAGIDADHPPMFMPSPAIIGIPVAAAPPAAAIINQFQGSNMGADLYNGTLL